MSHNLKINTIGLFSNFIKHKITQLVYFQILFPKFENTHNWWAEHGVRGGGGREKRIVKKRKKEKRKKKKNQLAERGAR